MDGYIIKHAFRHFLPAAILTGVILQVRIITDCIIVGHLIGPDAVSAINLYIPLEEIAYAILSVITLGASFLGAERMGGRDYRKASHFFTVSLAGTGVIALALVGLILLFFQPVISLLAGGEDNLIRSYAATYTLWMLPTFVVMAPNGVLRYFANDDGHPRLVTASILVSFLLNPVLDFVLIRYAGLGMAGAALATLVSDLAGLGVLAFHFLRGRSSFRLQLSSAWWTELCDSVRMGIPLSAFVFLLAVIGIALNRIVYHFQGAQGLYIWAVVGQIISICEMLLEGVADMNQTMGGILLGSYDFKSFRSYVRRALRFVQITILAITVLLLLFPEAVYTLFGADGGGMADREGCRVLRIIALYLLPDMLLIFYENIHSLVHQERLSLVFQVLQAAGLAVFPFLAGLLCPTLFWWSFPLLGVLLCLAQWASAWLIQRKNPGVRAPFLEEVFPVDVEADFPVEFSRESIDETMEKIRTIVTICELPSTKELCLTICCEDMMNNLLYRKEPAERHDGFEIRIVDKPDLTRVTVKDVGKPFNPVIQFDDPPDAVPDETQPLELRTINQLCDHITHKYLFGINVTYLEFSKQ